MKKNLKLITVLSLVLMNGCISTRDYVGIEPVYPIPNNDLRVFGGFPVVKSLQPTLKWKQLGVEGYSYDIAVWEKPDTNDIKHIGIDYNDPEYYVENIKDTQHKVVPPLLPDTIYMLTVRARKGGNVGQWAVYKEHTIYSLGVASGSAGIWNVPFSFKTPAK